MLGWNTGFESIMPRGHEILTEGAVGARGPGVGGRLTFTVRGQPITTIVTPAEVTAIVEGNRAVDVADLSYTQRLISEARKRPYLMPLLGPAVVAGGVAFGTGQVAGHVVHSLQESDQRHHSLRRNLAQNWRDALREIIADLRTQHRGVLAEANAGARLRKIGAALHLIQDSYCTAHTERSGRCITYVRNYGPHNSPVYQASGAGREHSFPGDPRDNVSANPLQAAQAVAASTQYLQIVFKVLYGRQNSIPEAIAEAEREFEAFVQQHFTPCG